VISNVTFPAYSRIRDDTKRFAEAYLKVLQVIAFIAVPMAGAIFVFAAQLVELVLSEKWMPVVPMIQVLVCAGLIRAFMDTTVPVFNAAGKPRIHTKLQMRNLMTLGVSIYPLAHLLGMMGVSVAVLLGNAVAASGALYEAHRVLKYEAIRFVKITLFPLTGILLSALFAVWLKRITQFDVLREVVVLGILGIVIYVLLIWLLDRLFGYEMGRILKESLISLKTSER
jgi:O-antigen/teichoic acid export membrane protein